MSRMIRAQFYRYKDYEYVMGFAHPMGAKDRKLIFRHILPNAIGPNHYASYAWPFRAQSLPKPFFLTWGLGIQAPEPSIGGTACGRAESIEHHRRT